MGYRHNYHCVLSAEIKELYIWLGMKHSFKTLRIIGLVLFGITLFKLFAFDIKNIPPGGKILAFILLGIVLLTVSFMYQRLKN